MQIRVLGPLRLVDAGQEIPVSGARQRAVLALLLLHANEVVPSERLLVELWGDDAPASAANALQAAISRLRKALPPGRLSTRAPGYVLRVFQDEVDARLFEQLMLEGREALEAGDAGGAARTLRRALARWQGPALADFRYEPFAQTEIARLEELRLACLEERIEADLADGLTGELIGELRSLMTEHPLRERLRRLLMLALYRSGRPSEALDVYRDLRDVMIDELGIGPSPALTALEVSILRHDPSLSPASAATDRTRPVLARRPVTVLSAVLTIATESGTAMDPETGDAVYARSVATITAALDRYGGRLATTAGERIMGVFGATSVHEDDALRAARASLAAGAGLDVEANAMLRRYGMRLTYRFGVATGEALVGAADAQGFAREPGGRAVALAEAAEPGQILISQESHALAASALVVEPAGPDRFRLRSARDGVRALALRLDVPLTGRSLEIRRLETAFEHAVKRRQTVLVTILGEAGLGKTRLAHELASRLGTKATVLTGRCLPYGEGITFWPLREIVRQACSGEETPAAVSALLEGEPQAAAIAERLTQAIDSGDLGRSDGTEIFWAARRFLEVLARSRPLVVIVEDLHWAEPTFLDLIESIGLQPGTAAMMLLCVARPDLLEQRPSWAVSEQLGSGDTGRTGTIELSPLPPNSAAALLDALAVDHDLPASVQAGILQTAGGNPLYIEQLAISLTEQPWNDAHPPLPPTIQALLAARLGRLGPGERQVLACAAIVGQRFGLPALTQMLPPEARGPLSRHLRTLISKGLINDAQADPEEPEGYGFRHILIQQATYRAVPKGLRAELHERFADWVEQSSGKPAGQWEEILGYHLAEAARYVDELIGPVSSTATAATAGDHGRSLARRAAGHLETAGRSALDRGDALAAVNLLERAGALTPEDDPALPSILTTLGMALAEAGHFGKAETVLATAQDRALAGGDEVRHAHARVQALFLGIKVDLERGTARIASSLPGLREVFDRFSDELGRCRVLRLEAVVHWNNARSAAAEAAWRQAATHARSSDDGSEVAEILGWLASAALWGPTPAQEGIDRCEGYLDEIGNRPSSRAVILLHLAGLLAMRDRAGPAQARLDTATAILEGLGPTMTGVITQPAAFVAMLAGDPATAERYLRAEFDSLQRMGEKGFLATSAALLARAITAQEDGRDDEVQRLVATSRAAGAGQDLSAQIIGDGVLARILAQKGYFDEAEKLASSATARAAGTDLISQHGNALLDLAYVRRLQGRRPEARTATEQALALYERKGDLPGTRESRRSLALI